MTVTGSIKFDLKPSEAVLQGAAQWRGQWGERPVWIAASTHAGEDELVLQAHQQLLQHQPQALLILVPRHPERFDAVARLVQQADLRLVRRSAGQQPEPADQVFLGDSMGELMQFYACADVAFVGGSLIAGGGHNYLEPAALGLPILSGPHRFNFVEISELLEQAGALVEVAGAEPMAVQVGEWLNSDQTRRQAGAAGQAVVKANQGALERLLQGVSGLLGN